MSPQASSTSSSRVVRQGVAVLAMPAANDDRYRIVSSADHSGDSHDGLAEVIELLSAANYPFEVIDSRRITLETFLDGEIVRYSSILILPPFFHLSIEARKILVEISHDYGVSLICSLDGPVQSESVAWGVQRIGKTSLLWPLWAKIKQWPGSQLEKELIANYYPWAGLAGVRARGFKRLDLKRVAGKLYRLFTDSVVPFRRASLDGEAAILAESPNAYSLAHSFRYGRAINYCFSIGFRKLLNRYNEMHRLFRAVIESNSGFGMVSVDLDGSMALRIDDPGACVSDYLGGRNGALQASEWDIIEKWLDEKGFSASVVYTPRWIDDGDPKVGVLYINGRKIEPRTVGQAFASPSVKYFSKKRGKISDHEDEFKGLLKARNSGLIDIQSHGLTHLLPDYRRWARSRDRTSNSRWYHEFYNVVDDKSIDKESQTMSMTTSREEIARFFESVPCVLTPSGHKHGHDSDIEAFKAGYLLFSSDFTSYKNKDIIVRNSKMPGLFLFLKNPNSCFLRSGYPFVGVIHDEDLSKTGLEQLENMIQGWMNQGVKRIISLRELTASLCLSLKSWFSTCPAALRIEADLPNISRNDSPNHFAGTQILLRTVLPEGYRLNSDSRVLPGDEHVLSLSTNDERIVQLVLRCKERLKLELVLPLENIKDNLDH
jgi:hypothetical protein